MPTMLSIFADYHQIYLCDPAHNEDWSALWTDETVDDRVVATPHTLVFSTGRNMMVPVSVIEHSAAPDIEAMAHTADHVVAGSLLCSSGELKLAGCTDYLPDAFAMPMPPGLIGAAFLSFDLASIDPVDGLDGNDRYELHIWPTAQPVPVTVVKRWAPDAGQSAVG